MAKKTSNPALVEEVLTEFTPIGGYRIRLVRNKRPKATPILDIREYIKSESFEGFTRRRVRIVDAEQLDLFIKVLQEAKEMKPWPKSKK